MTHYVYALTNPDGRIYIGQTSDLQRRVGEHNDPSNHNSRFTKRYPGPWTLAYSEECTDRSAAMKREKLLKTSAGRRWLREQLSAGAGRRSAP